MGTITLMFETSIRVTYSIGRWIFYPLCQPLQPNRLLKIQKQTNILQRYQVYDQRLILLSTQQSLNQSSFTVRTQSPCNIVKPLICFNKSQISVSINGLTLKSVLMSLRLVMTSMAWSVSSTARFRCVANGDKAWAHAYRTLSELSAEILDIKISSPVVIMWSIQRSASA